MELSSPSPEPVGLPAPVPAEQPVATGPERFSLGLSLVLRAGVLFAGATFALGLGLYFLEGAPRPLAAQVESPHALEGLASVSAPKDPLAVLTLGLLALVAVPVGRVAISLVHFARERDRLYVVLTTVVLAVLVLGVAMGKAL